MGLSALTVAEYFRDERGQDVLLFIDKTCFRFTQAGSEMSALLGRIPSAVGYQPTLGTEMGAMQERITSTDKGSITSVPASCVPADDLTDPAPATAFAHLDATTVLSRSIAERTRPSTRSTPRAASRAPRSWASITTTRPAKSSAPCSATRTSRTSSRFSVWTIFSEDDRNAVQRARKGPALPGTAVPRRRGLHEHARQVRQARGHGCAQFMNGFKMILAGELDHVQGPYFNFKGGIEEVTAHFDRDSNKGK